MPKTDCQSVFGRQVCEFIEDRFILAMVRLNSGAQKGVEQDALEALASSLAERERFVNELD
ncbi:MAG: hypothetical protein COB20_14545 [SAR86 cluster bacterium]|uniref:Uncharacterized protein n=1 Tax=SAR86 cluster bacterium TaxID=2030880 RepID=A0A2A4WWP2_9GAMM|nr:MAG: hypothetical protein COB20_14545 [SAR86 cluster bacterium]